MSKNETLPNPLAGPGAIVIVSPSLTPLADATNGNAHTALRWASMLGGARTAQTWDGNAHADAQLLIALHARRSTEAVAAWNAQKPNAPCIVVLTGTDLYRDIHADASALRSLDLSDGLIVLQEKGLDELKAEHRTKAHVVVQSAPRLPHAALRANRLRVLMVGHLRDEKDPLTYLEAARALQIRDDIHFTHIGEALDAALGEATEAAHNTLPHYEWLGGRSHRATRQAMCRADVLVHASKMEGGAHAIIEAVQSGTPVLASRISGNVGLLGDDYSGYFPLGDAKALAELLSRCRDDVAFVKQLSRQCAARSRLFEPMAERDALRAVVEEIFGEKT
jgi:putative glycosyltransferase (TIGR04348 family)